MCYVHTRCLLLGGTVLSAGCWAATIRNKDGPQNRTEPRPQPASRSVLTLSEDSRRSAARAAASGGGKASPLLSRLNLAKPSSPCWFPVRCRWTCPSIYCVSSLRYITLGTGSGSSDLDPRRSPNQTKSMRSWISFRVAFFFFSFLSSASVSEPTAWEQGPKKNTRPRTAEKPPPLSLVTSSADRSQRRDAESSAWCRLTPRGQRGADARCCSADQHMRGFSRNQERRGGGATGGNGGLFFSASSLYHVMLSIRYSYKQITRHTLHDLVVYIV